MVFPSKQWDTGSTTNLSEALFDCSCLVEVRQICLKDAAICFVVMSFSLEQRTSFQRQLKCEDLRRNTWNNCVYWRILVSPKRLSLRNTSLCFFHWPAVSYSWQTFRFGCQRFQAVQRDVSSAIISAELLLARCVGLTCAYMDRALLGPRDGD